MNSAAHTAYQGLPLPLLFLCEDNGLGISVPSPQGWVEQALRARTQLRYAYADGTEPEEVLATARELVDWIREHRRPAVLHLRTVRFLSHAGADVESAYRSPQAIRADWDADPLLATGRLLAATRRLERRAARARLHRDRRAGARARRRGRPHSAARLGGGDRQAARAAHGAAAGALAGRDATASR